MHTAQLTLDDSTTQSGHVHTSQAHLGALVKARRLQPHPSHVKVTWLSGGLSLGGCWPMTPTGPVVACLAPPTVSFTTHHTSITTTTTNAMSLRLRQAIPGRPRRDSPNALDAISTQRGSYFVRISAPPPSRQHRPPLPILPPSTAALPSSTASHRLPPPSIPLRPPSHTPRHLLCTGASPAHLPTRLLTPGLCLLVQRRAPRSRWRPARRPPILGRAATPRRTIRKRARCRRRPRTRRHSRSHTTGIGVPNIRSHSRADSRSSRGAARTSYSGPPTPRDGRSTRQSSPTRPSPHSTSGAACWHSARKRESSSGVPKMPRLLCGTASGPVTLNRVPGSLCRQRRAMLRGTLR